MRLRVILEKGAKICEESALDEQKVKNVGIQKKNEKIAGKQEKNWQDRILEMLEEIEDREWYTK